MLVSVLAAMLTLLSHSFTYIISVFVSIVNILSEIRLQLFYEQGKSVTLQRVHLGVEKALFHAVFQPRFRWG